MFNLFTDIKLLRAIKNVKSGILVTTIPSFNVLSVKFANKNIIKIGQEHKQFAIYNKSIQNKIKNITANLMLFLVYQRMRLMIIKEYFQMEK